MMMIRGLPSPRARQPASHQPGLSSGAFPVCLCYSGLGLLSRCLSLEPGRGLLLPRRTTVRFAGTLPAADRPADAHDAQVVSRCPAWAAGCSPSPGKPRGMDAPWLGHDRTFAGHATRAGGCTEARDVTELPCSQNVRAALWVCHVERQTATPGRPLHQCINRSFSPCYLRTVRGTCLYIELIRAPVISGSETRVQ
ncbi:hypothetical protein GGR56DRAFT_24473 [Xylariaceae sp. FL0804]|nr:hypothetical protein GGR56DRAFT_24473 [Xylariaceae sp. FL0804]